MWTDFWRFSQLAGLIACLTAGTANAGEPSWTSRYLKADNAGELSVCIASVIYSDANFSVRLHGDNLDFIFGRDDFTLPYDKALGEVVLNIDGQEYLLFAITLKRDANSRFETSQTMFLYPSKNDVAPLFNALRYGDAARIVFPTGKFYNLGLRGSNKALAAASNCWSRNSTGPLNNNPFEDGEENEKPVKNNPFDDT